MITEYLAQVDHQQHERELAETLERRRVAAERLVAEQFNGDRLALMAHLARTRRATLAVARPVSC
ncbi:hypothetical protein [Aeromicrobium sp. NPDC092404]|uniref:hypothetical protein n=1 Tax=Aeromicrobium sp. NPDC092404 TaxID=3154976 RepID=UPI0034156B69